MARAVVLMSGGQDSTTCLAWALSEFERVVALSIDYGQRHEVELACAAAICRAWGVERHVIPVNTLTALGGAALTDESIDVEGKADIGSRALWAASRGLPSTFVPGRNLLFFTVAAAWGLPRGYNVLVTGVCEADRSGYPDCRLEFVRAASDAIQLAMDAPEFAISAPLLTRSKAETWLLAEELGVRETIVQETHTCYHGHRSPMHKWGAGCGQCPACLERAAGYSAAFG